jgi:thiol-disulfide isomerase/thioredoxin
MNAREVANRRAVKIAGALLLVAVGIAVGLHMRARAPHAGAVRMAAGEAAGPGESAGAPVAAGATEANPPVTGEAELFNDSPTPSAAIPDRLPAFSLADRTGKSVSIGTWRDKSLIINFWATWCAPCRREIPLLGSLHREWAARGVEVVGIAVDHAPQVAAYADETKIAYPLLIGEQDALDVAASLGFASPVFPFTVFTDRRGEVVTLYVGELHRAQADLILSVVQSLDQNRVPLQEARRRIAAGLQSLTPAS